MVESVPGESVPRVEVTVAEADEGKLRLCNEIIINQVCQVLIVIFSCVCARSR